MADYMRDYGTPSPQLRGEFFLDTERDGMASAQAGRDIYRSVERVRVVIPGSVASIVVQNVDDTHRARWPEAYAAFQAGLEAPLSGIPLEEWPVLNRAQVAELKYLQIRTVEELANLSDIAVQRIGMGGMGLRLQAKGYIDDAEREAHNTKLMAENERLRAEVATYQAQVEQLGQHVLRLAESNQYYRDLPPPLQTYVPGEDDPVEQAKAGAPPLARTISALDALAARPRPSGRRRRPAPAAAAALATMPPPAFAGAGSEEMLAIGEDAEEAA